MLSIRDTTQEHIKDLHLNLREQDLREIEAMGLNPELAIHFVVERALVRKTILRDDRVVAIFGVVGSSLAGVGSCYLLTTYEIERFSPLKIFREYKNQVEQMHEIFPVLQACVDTRYKEALRLIKLVGFKETQEIMFENNCKFMFLTKEIK